MTTKEQAQKALNFVQGELKSYRRKHDDWDGNPDTPPAAIRMFRERIEVFETIEAALQSHLTAPEDAEVREAVFTAKDALDYWREELKSGDWSIDNCCPLFKFKHLETLIRAATAPIKTDVADQIRVWLKVQANTETETKSKAAFIEAHNAALKIIEAAPKQSDIAEKLAGALKDIVDCVAITETMGEICQCSDFSDAREALTEYEKMKVEVK